MIDIIFLTYDYILSFEWWIYQERRPFLATECDNLQEAEKWRQQV